MENNTSTSTDCVDAIQTLYLQCRESGKDEEAQELLDDAVHDLSEKLAIESNPYCPDEDLELYEEHLDSASLDASNINNGGYGAQITYLVQQSAAGGLEEKLTKIIEQKLEQ